MWGIVGGAILGALASIAITIAVESLRRPRLRLSIEAPPLEHSYHEPRYPVQNMRYLRLILHNKPLPGVARWMVSGAALQCRAAITFHHLDDGQDVFGRAMEGHWSASPEPVASPIVDQQGMRQYFLLDPQRLTVSSRIDVYPGEMQTLDIAIRADQDADSYGWSNESYFSEPQWRNPRWRLPPGRYLVKAVVTSSGQKCVGHFRLLNDLSRADFRLENATQIDRAKLMP